MNLLMKWMRQCAAIRCEFQARRAFSLGRTTEAAAHARAFQSLEPESPTANYLLAQVLVDAGRHEEALPHLLSVTGHWPDDAAAWYAIGVCRDYLDDPGQAVAAYRRTLILAPHWVIVLKHLGRCAWRVGEDRLASRALARYCVEVPDDKEAHDLLGYLSYAQGRLRDASSHYAEAARLSPGDPKLDRNARLLYRRSATS